MRVEVGPGPEESRTEIVQFIIPLSFSVRGSFDPPSTRRSWVENRIIIHELSGNHFQTAIYQSTFKASAFQLRRAKFDEVKFVGKWHSTDGQALQSLIQIYPRTT